MQFLLLLALIALIIQGLRMVLTHIPWRAKPGESFQGKMIRLGHNLVCEPDRSHLCAAAVKRTTVICFPGFLEDMRYFLEVYKQTPVRLIIINNANYHNPFQGDEPSTPSWYRGNPHRLGTIAHDAHCVNQVVEHMTDSERIVLHGHSRGGAVVLEAGNQQPQRAQHLETILEAAVVPQGRMAGNLERILQPVGFYLFPFVMALMRFVPESKRLKSPMMWVSNATKDKLVASLPFTPRQYGTAVVNGADIISWQAQTGYTCYDHFKSVTLYVGERDSVLWLKAMIRSASQSKSVNIVQTRGTDHFISLEDPDSITAYFANEPDPTFS